jgi:hypothetical protein
MYVRTLTHNYITLRGLSPSASQFHNGKIDSQSGLGVHRAYAS